MERQSNNIILKALIAAIVIVLIIITVIFFRNRGAEVDPNSLANLDPLAALPTEEDADRIVSNLISGWDEFQKTISPRPEYFDGNAEDRWNEPDAVQFIGNDAMFVRIQDDSHQHTVIVGYGDGRFTMRDVIEGAGVFDPGQWQDVFREYGNENFRIRTYAREVVRDGQIVAFDMLTEVLENVFVGDTIQKG